MRFFFFFFLKQPRYLRPFPRLTKMLMSQVSSLGFLLWILSRNNFRRIETPWIWCCSTQLFFGICCFLWRDALASIFLIKLLFFLPIAHIVVKPFFALSVSPCLPFSSVFFFLFILFVVVLCSPITFHCVGADNYWLCVRTEIHLKIHWIICLSVCHSVCMYILVQVSMETRGYRYCESIFVGVLLESSMSS